MESEGVYLGYMKKKRKTFKKNFLCGRGYGKRQQKQRILDIKKWKEKIKINTYEKASIKL